MKRHKVPGRKARKMFRRTAGVAGAHRKNLMGNSLSMRGGIRL